MSPMDITLKWLLRSVSCYLYNRKKQVKKRHGQWGSSVNVTHILYPGDFLNVYIGETIADSNKTKTRVLVEIWTMYLISFLVFIAPTGTLQAVQATVYPTSLERWWWGGIQLIVIFNLTARCH